MSEVYEIDTTEKVLFALDQLKRERDEARAECESLREEVELHRADAACHMKTAMREAAAKETARARVAELETALAASLQYVDDCAHGSMGAGFVAQDIRALLSKGASDGKV